jgi:hypothetical protein
MDMTAMASAKIQPYSVTPLPQAESSRTSEVPPPTLPEISGVMLSMSFNRT